MLLHLCPLLPSLQYEGSLDEMFAGTSQVPSGVTVTGTAPAS
jgi:hypothetical protein